MLYNIKSAYKEFCHMDEIQTLLDAEDAEGLLNLGTEWFRLGHEEKAFECYRAACKLGNVVAMGNLGYCYQTGRGVKADNRLAAYCFERASRLDDPRSMLKMGDFYFHGKGGLSKDRARAVGYYLRAYEIAASASEPDASLLADLCYRLGICKKDGQGTEQNFEDAYEYFQAAAELICSSENETVGRMNLMEKIQGYMDECEEHF